MILLWNYKLNGSELSTGEGLRRRVDKNGRTVIVQTPGVRTLNKTHEKMNETEFDISISSGSNSVFYESPFSIGYSSSLSNPDEVGLRNKHEGKREPLFPGNFQNYDSTGLSIGKRTIINPLWMYNDYADPRTGGIYAVHYGRVYHTKIRCNNPVVYIQPGKPKFLAKGGIAGFFLGLGDSSTGINSPSDALRKAILNGLKGNNSGAGVSFDLSALINELAFRSGFKNSPDGKNGNPMKYYDFQPSFYEYRQYVKGLLDELMIRMGLDGSYSNDGNNISRRVAETDILTAFYSQLPNWAEIAAQQDDKTTDKIAAAFIPIRIEKSSDVSESFSTSTGASALEQMVKGVSDMAKEANFLTNDSGGMSLGGIARWAMNLASNAVTLGNNDNAMTTLSTGGNLIFPEIWKESTMSKSYSLTIKLHSPYGDRRTYFENVLLPYAMILGLVLPKQAGNAIYVSPPIIRMYSKGWFGCDMGIVDSVSIKRGNDKNDWTIDRLPRTIEITVSVKDLFNTLILSLNPISFGSKLSIFKNRNTALREYLNVMGGLDTFSESSFQQRWTNFWHGQVYNIKRGLDARTWGATAMGWPGVQTVARITRNYSR